MTRRVTVSRIQCRDQPLRERKVCSAKLVVQLSEVGGEPPLLLVQEKPPLSCQRRREEQGKRPWGNVTVSKDEDGNRRTVDRHRRDDDRDELREGRTESRLPTERKHNGRKRRVENLGDKRRRSRCCHDLTASARGHQCCDGSSTSGSRRSRDGAVSEISDSPGKRHRKPNN